jgi:hypothetical protein
MIDVERVVVVGRIRLVRPNMSQNTLIVHHKRRHTTSYNLHASNLALRAIRFKFHDWLKQRPIGFQSVTLETVQNDKHFCAYRCSVVLGSITGLTRLMQWVDTRMHTRPTRQRISKSNGLLIDTTYNFITFSTRITAYKK